MTPECPHTPHLLESDLGPSDHCDHCRETARALRERQDDLERALDRFAQAGDPAAAIRRAMATAPPPPRQTWDRWFHGSLIAAAAGLVLAVLWLAGTGLDASDPVSAGRDLTPEMDAVEAIASIPWNELEPDEWAAQAADIWELAEAMEQDADPLDPEVLPVLHALYVQAGRAAQNSNRAVEPYYGMVSGQRVVIPWYRAASLEIFEPELSGDQAVAHYVERIEAGALPPYYGAPEGLVLPEREVPEPGPITPLEASVLVEDVAAIPWNALDEADWSARAERLFEAAESLETRLDPDHPGTAILLFDLWTQAGRAAENANDAETRYYGEVGGRTVNVGWYRAASVAHHAGRELEPTSDLMASVLYYLDKINDGDLPARTVGR